MKIWIDLANTPQVVFFAPIIDKFKADGHEVVISLRDFAQTLSVAKKFNIQGEVIGGHGGKSKIGKLFNLAERTVQLMKFAKGKGIDMALSHNSYHQIMAARLMGKKTVTLMDYEGQPANHLAFRVANKVIVPEYFPAEDLRRFGAVNGKAQTYKGFKEQVYLDKFAIEKGFIDELARVSGIEPADFDGKVVVTVRTPPALAAYHQFDNDLFPALLKKLNANDTAIVLVLPRTDEQRRQVQQEYPNLIVPQAAVDGRSLCAFSDMVISAGGTMNREAALLGTPVWSTFAGKQPAVDAELQSRGMMKQLKSLDDVEALPVRKKAHKATSQSNTMLDEVLTLILN